MNGPLVHLEKIFLLSFCSANKALEPTLEPLCSVVPRVHPLRAGGGIDALPHAEPAPPHQQGAAQLHRVALTRPRALQVGNREPNT